MLLKQKCDILQTHRKVCICFLSQQAPRNHVPVRTWASSRWRTWIGINGTRAKAVRTNTSRNPYLSDTTAKRCGMLRRETRTGGVVSWITRSRRGGPTTSIWSTKGWVGGRVRIAAAIGVTRTAAWRRSPRQGEPRSWKRLSGIYESAPCDRRSDDRATSSNASSRARAPRQGGLALSSISKKARDIRRIAEELTKTRVKLAQMRWIREIRRTDRVDTRRSKTFIRTILIPDGFGPPIRTTAGPPARSRCKAIISGIIWMPIAHRVRDPRLGIPPTKVWRIRISSGWRGSSRNTKGMKISQRRGRRGTRMIRGAAPRWRP